MKIRNLIEISHFKVEALSLFLILTLHMNISYHVCGKLEYQCEYFLFRRCSTVVCSTNKCCQSFAGVLPESPSPSSSRYTSSLPLPISSHALPLLPRSLQNRPKNPAPAHSTSFRFSLYVVVAFASVDKSGWDDCEYSSRYSFLP